MKVSPSHYNGVAIILHWLMALAFFFMLGSGIVMEYFEIDKSFKFNLFQWHKSAGLLLLVAFALRIIWRLISEIPKLPEHFARWEKIAAKGGHWALYVCMLLMPLSGWAVVSSSSYGLPTYIFNMFEWPHIPGIAGNEGIHEFAEDAHFVLAIVFGLLIIGHIGAVVKHVIFDHENLLKRMWWTK